MNIDRFNANWPGRKLYDLAIADYSRVLALDPAMLLLEHPTAAVERQVVGGHVGGAHELERLDDELYTREKS
jgi:ABC-type histidine transport system ATPase subunit